MAHEKIYSLAPLSGEKRVQTVKIADLKVSSDPLATLVTYALGSCIAVTAYDPRERIGGLLHFLLPCVAADKKNRGECSPCKYSDTGLKLLLKKMCELGAVQRRLIIKVVGGARILKASGATDIGRQNYESLLEQLAGYRLRVRAGDVGGTHSRTAMLEIDTGTVTIRGNGRVITI